MAGRKRFDPVVAEFACEDSRRHWPARGPSRKQKSGCEFGLVEGFATDSVVSQGGQECGQCRWHQGGAFVETQVGLLVDDVDAATVDDVIATLMASEPAKAMYLSRHVRTSDAA